MTPFLVTAVMPAYNAERYIAESLESLLAQDYSFFEVIVVDDGSTDGTASVAESYPKVTTIRAPHRGPAAARNTALLAAAGALITTFDADDLWPANRLSLQVSYLVDHLDVDCVLGRQEWINPPPWLGRDAIYGDLDGIPLGSAMFRREALDRLGGYDDSFFHSEDMDLLIRARELGLHIAILPDVVWYRRCHDAQLTATAPAVSPLLRSLRAKLQRQRAAADVRDAGGGVV